MYLDLFSSFFFFKFLYSFILRFKARPVSMIHTPGAFYLVISSWLWIGTNEMLNNNIPIEDTIAFGDGLNDIEMLDVAGFSVAMGNAHEEALKQTKLITAHVDEDGLMSAMRYLNLIK